MKFIKPPIQSNILDHKKYSLEQTVTYSTIKVISKTSEKKKKKKR